jgi:hypothetical protein
VTVAVRFPPIVQTGTRDRQAGVGPQRRQPGQLGAYRGHRIDLRAMTRRAVHAQQKSITATRRAGIDPERRVLPVSDEPHPRISQRVRIQGPHRQTPHPGNLPTV